ncbi:MAG TPA: GNAT family protein [Gemmataceae bacterium]|nr:GNAT family protein [Gemmataceae bacterium]
MASVPFTELYSSRLILRRLRREDAAALCAYRSAPEVARFQSWETFDTEDGARLIAGQSGHSPDIPGTWFQLAITRADSGEMIGDCGLHCRQEDPRQMEIGITLAPAHQGHGYATEALGVVLDYLFVRLGKHRVTATTDADNAAAAALLRRLGFRREGHFIDNVWFKGKWGSEFSFALLRREWEQRQPAGCT